MIREGNIHDTKQTTHFTLTTIKAAGHRDRYKYRSGPAIELLIEIAALKRLPHFVGRQGKRLFNRLTIQIFNVFICLVIDAKRTS